MSKTIHSATTEAELEPGLSGTSQYSTQMMDGLFHRPSMCMCHSELQNLGPLEVVRDLIRRHSSIQGDTKMNNRCPYNQKMEAADRAMWSQARECLGVLGEARSEKEGIKAGFRGAWPP